MPRITSAPSTPQNRHAVLQGPRNLEKGQNTTNRKTLSAESESSTRYPVRKSSEASLPLVG